MSAIIFFSCMGLIMYIAIGGFIDCSIFGEGDENELTVKENLGVMLIWPLFAIRHSAKYVKRGLFYTGLAFITLFKLPMIIGTTIASGMRVYKDGK